MKFQRAALSAAHLWSSPFARWQGSLADVSSLDLAVAVTGDALAARDFDRGRVDADRPRHDDSAAGRVLRRALDRRAARHGRHRRPAHRPGVRDLGRVHRRRGDGGRGRARPLVAGRHRRPHQQRPAARLSARPLDGRQPGASRTGCSTTSLPIRTPAESMVATAEAVAREGGMSRQAIDELTLLRYRQYERALADDRAFQRRTLQPVVIGEGRRRIVVETRRGHSRDQRRRPARIEAGAGRRRRHLRQPDASGRRRRGLRSSPMPTTRARSPAATASFACSPPASPAPRRRACRRRRRRRRRTRCATPGWHWGDVAIVNTHNPFVVNDLWFAQQTGFALERMNPYGCSLVYGHPQGPTGMRGIVELVEALRREGGGVGVFTGCAAGDTGAALVLRVD